MEDEEAVKELLLVVVLLLLPSIIVDEGDTPLFLLFDDFVLLPIVADKTLFEKCMKYSICC